MSDAPIKVLHVEDNQADAEVVARFLSYATQERFTVIRAKSLSSTLDYLESGQFDVVLLDLNLPDSDGQSAFDRVYAAARKTPIVVLTGVGDEPLGTSYVRRGAQDYLVKSRFDSSLLIRVLRYAIERMRLMSELAEARRREEYERELRLLGRMSVKQG